MPRHFAANLTAEEIRYFAILILFPLLGPVDFCLLRARFTLGVDEVEAREEAREVAADEDLVAYTEESLFLDDSQSWRTVKGFSSEFLVHGNRNAH